MKTISLFAATLVVACSASFSYAANAVCGDVNGNGTVTTSDAQSVLRKSVGQNVTLLCPPPSSPVTTGQTTCYDDDGDVVSCAMTGQDGELLVGVARSFTDNGDGTITDNVTGLMWEKLVNDGLFHDKDDHYTWQNGLHTKAGKLADLEFAGHDDWRTPSRWELETLVNLAATLPATFSVFNTNCIEGCTAANCSCTPSGPLWTATTFLSDPSSAWTVSFSDGSVGPSPKTTMAPAVRAVRDAK